MEEGLALNVGKDLDWLSGELEWRRFLVGDNLLGYNVSVECAVYFREGFVCGEEDWECRNVERWGGRGRWKKRDIRCDLLF